MTFAVSLSQLLLAGAFSVAAIAKLADRAGTRRAIEGFGAPRLAVAGAILLPVVELAIAVGLIFPSTARAAAAAAMLLLALFCAAIARAIRAGRAVECNCFGGFTQTEVGRGALLRNLVLAGLAGFVALGGKSVGALRWITVPAPGDRLAIALLIAGLAALGWFCWALLRQNGRLLLRLDGDGGGRDGSGAEDRTLSPLERGSPAPSFAGRDLRGRPVSLESLLEPGRPVVLVFTDPGCGACESALDAVALAQRERGDELTLAVISSGGIDRIEEKATRFGLDRVVPQEDESVFDAYRVNGVPGVVEIDANGMVEAPAALGVDAVEEVVRGAPAPPPSEPAGLVNL